MSADSRVQHALLECGMTVHQDTSPAIRILLVEDSPALQDVLISILRGMPGVTLVGVAATATEAIGCFEEASPEIVILDLVLREGSGLEVLGHIRALKSSCRVLVFTSHDSEPYRNRCLQAGADAFYSKARNHRELIADLHTYRG